MYGCINCNEEVALHISREQIAVSLPLIADAVMYAILRPGDSTSPIIKIGSHFLANLSPKLRSMNADDLAAPIGGAKLKGPTIAMFLS